MNSKRLSELRYKGYITDSEYKELKLALIALEKRPKGEWIVDEDSVCKDFRKCSNCNEDAEWLDGGSQFLPNFCPNCGADMRKEKE